MVARYTDIDECNMENVTLENERKNESYRERGEKENALKYENERECK